MYIYVITNITTTAMVLVMWYILLIFKKLLDTQKSIAISLDLINTE